MNTFFCKNKALSHLKKSFYYARNEEKNRKYSSMNKINFMYFLIFIQGDICKKHTKCGFCCCSGFSYSLGTYRLIDYMTHFPGHMTALWTGMIALGSQWFHIFADFRPRWYLGNFKNFFLIARMNIYDYIYYIYMISGPTQKHG